MANSSHLQFVSLMSSRHNHHSYSMKFYWHCVKLIADVMVVSPEPTATGPFGARRLPAAHAAAPPEPSIAAIDSAV